VEPVAVSGVSLQGILLVRAPGGSHQAHGEGRRFFIMKRMRGWSSVALVLLWGAATGVQAENVKGRWHLGGGLSFTSTTDDIRSNAAVIVFGNPGADGIPDSGDEAILFEDRRPDDLLSRETTIEEGLQLDFNASYGVTDWLSLQLDVGWYAGDVVQLDTYVTTSYPQDINGDGFINTAEVNDTFQQSQPIDGGELTQIPVTLSAVFRFRRDSPLNPYVGAGLGYIFTDISTSSDLRARDELLADANLRFFLGPDETGPVLENFPEWDGLTLDIDDTYEFHLMAGAEYFFNSHLSMYFNARYNFVNDDLVVNVSGYDSQLTAVYDSLQDTLPFCTDISFDTWTSDPVLPRTPGPDGQVDWADFGTNRDFTPGSTGLRDSCRPGTGTRTSDTILIQGGDINLSALNVGLGLRWYF
jgi:outer membrane protein W